MIGLIFFGLAAVVFVLQIKTSSIALQNLYCDFRFDKKLAEPGEVITCAFKVVNAWFFPVLYINFIVRLPQGARIVDDGSDSVGHRLYLLPRQKYTGEIRFTLPERGIYKNGRYFLETGDFLGFQSKVLSKDLKTDIVVMPDKSRDEVVLNTMGGYLGDISVRRYIMEDPVLTIGYRDYTGKEPMKDISWKQTARRNQLMVKNSDYTTDINVAVVVNMQSSDPERLEECLRILRNTCEQLEEKRIPYELLSNGDIGNSPEGYGNKHFNHLMLKCGRSGLISYFSFEYLIDRCIQKKKNNRSYIIITAPLSAKQQAQLNRLQNVSDHPLCLITAGGQQDD